MTITHQIDRLAKKYEIDYSHFRNESENLTKENDDVVQKMPISILLDIKEEFSANSTIDGFYFYAKEHIEDKSRISELLYSLLLLTEGSIDQVNTHIGQNKHEYERKFAIDKTHAVLDFLDSKITNQEQYLYQLTETLAFFRMEVDKLKAHPDFLKTKKIQTASAFIGLNWVGPRRLDLVNELFRALHGDYLDPQTKYKDFEKLFLELSMDDSFKPINWIHRGQAFSLRYLFFLLTQDSALLTSTKLNKVLSLAFTINNKKLNPGTLRTYNSKIKDGRIPRYYADLEKQIRRILHLAK
ncbi:MAG: hypothetical protein HOM80_12150 [Bacteroidetes bacterium]|jgi:hypothetical protein|nr:hypothetical protein [Bacteroidota bacterium]MBT4969749.1 hypothetical protein [Bacteroidota bacterium]